MSWLLRHNWLWALLAFLLGAVITWLLLVRRESAAQTSAGATQGAAEPGREPAASGSAGTPLGRSPEPEEHPAARQQAEPPGTEGAPPAPAADVAPSAEPQPTPGGEVAPVSAGDTSRRAEKAAVADAQPTAVTTAPVVSEDEPAARAGDVPDEVPVGRFGAGSADALPDGNAPAGFTIKGNAQSMLFHTTESPYYGRTKAEVYFRTEEDAARAGFTKYVRKRKQK